MRIFTKRTSLILSLAMIVMLQFSAACSSKTIVTGPKKKPATTTTTQSAKPLPPGQAKKVNGDKSAKAYAPGQQKKKKK